MDDYLRAAMHVRGWNLARLAQACEVNDGLVAKWVSPNSRVRVVPSPASCYKIAAALDEDPDHILELAGHRQPAPAPEVPLDPIALELATTIVELREVLRDIPRQYWSTIVRTTGRQAVQYARDLAELLRSADNGAPAGANNGPRRAQSVGK